MTDLAQRATLVLERTVEDGEWFVVAYLVRDSGHRERKTLTRRDTREEATSALEELWGRMLTRT